ncbi:MAG: UDP-2,3-diacylglucosamine diphosphatase [Flavobacteriales bacterium]
MANTAKYLYFASDFHLGAPDASTSAERERTLLHWLQEIEHSAHSIFLLGDIFDFWFEYKTVIPKGYVRLLGKLAQLADNGIQIHFFKGNHDMWMFDYFEKELGVQIHHDDYQFEYQGKHFFLHHGDGLGPGDYNYKFLKLFFRSPICQWLFARLHPNFGIGLASFLSRRSRAKGGKKDQVYKGPEQEWLFQYVKAQQANLHQDYYLFGHRHLPLDLPVGTSKYINTGDWLKYNTFAVYDNSELRLMQWKDGKIIPYAG